MRHTPSNVVKLTTLVVALAFAACSSSKKKTNENNVADTNASDRALELNGSSDESTAGPLQTIYFAFDSSRLTSSAREILAMNAAFLKSNTNIDIQVEGHADERGGEQYNLALGERRARSVKDYLVALGVDGRRVSIISYGKTTPLAFGHDEDAWGRNRRANFVITAK